MHLKALSVSCGHECEGVNGGHLGCTEGNSTLGWKMLHLSLEIKTQTIHINYTHINTPKQTTSPFRFSLGFLLPSLASTGLMTCARLSELSV